MDARAAISSLLRSARRERIRELVCDPKDAGDPRRVVTRGALFLADIRELTPLKVGPGAKYDWILTQLGR